MTPRRDDGDDAANDSVWVDTFMMLHLGMAFICYFMYFVMNRTESSSDHLIGMLLLLDTMQ